MPEDDYGIITKSKPTHTYPAKINIGDRIITIVDTLSYRFLSKLVSVGDYDCVIKNNGIVDTIEVNGQLLIHVTDEGKKVIEMIDPIFFPKGKFIVIKEESYVYDAYSRCISDYNHLGYYDQHAEWDKRNKEINEMIKERDLYIMDWWVDKGKEQWEKNRR